MKGKVSPQTLEKLLEVSRQIAVLIEDNNQNMKDCYRCLRKMQNLIEPQETSWLFGKLRKLLNTRRKIFDTENYDRRD